MAAVPIARTRGPAALALHRDRPRLYAYGASRAAARRAGKL